MTPRLCTHAVRALAVAAAFVAVPASAQPQPTPPAPARAPSGSPMKTSPAKPADQGDDATPAPEDVEPTPPPPLPPLPPLPPIPFEPTFGGSGGALTKDWRNAIRILRVPGSGDFGDAEASASSEIFPDADKVFMQVFGTDPAPIEAARRGARRWLCSTGCAMNQPEDSTPEPIANDILVSIKLQTPTNPLPLTIWQPSETSPGGKLMFDPRLMGNRSYQDSCAFAPVTSRAKLGDRVGDCASERKLPAGGRSMPKPSAAEMFLGLRMPVATTSARFQYVAVTDQCGNAHVYPFQHALSVPVVIATGGCGKADGTVLRVAPSGGWARVTAFNLDSTAAGGVASVTYRVSVPALENFVSAEPAPLLFPDIRMDELTLDCGPRLLPPKPVATAAPPPNPKGPPPFVPMAAMTPDSEPVGQPLAHESLVIAPEPILGGSCRLEYRSPLKGRLIAPLALKVRVTRTDKAGGDARLLEADWVITPTDATFRIPKLPIDGESRLLVEVTSNPLSPLGNVVLLGDAGRYQRKDAGAQPLGEAQLQRVIGTATVHTAPLCGESNFQLANKAGRCFRGYFTVPAMLATLQITRAPWVERPLITRNVLSAVGVAFALDRYDPVERKAFPIAMQLGGFVEDLSDSRLGLTTYLGIAPTVPVLGSGGNTTNLGLLGGVGMSYITRSNGPDEGFKPTAFLSIVVQVGQVNPSLQDASGNSFGTYGTYTPAANGGAAGNFGGGGGAQLSPY